MSAALGPAESSRSGDGSVVAAESSRSGDSSIVAAESSRSGDGSVVAAEDAVRALWSALDRLDHSLTYLLPENCDDALFGIDDVRRKLNAVEQTASIQTSSIPSALLHFIDGGGSPEQFTLDEIARAQTLLQLRPFQPLQKFSDNLRDELLKQSASSHAAAAAAP